MAIGYFDGTTYYIDNVDEKDPRANIDISTIVIRCTDGTEKIYKRDQEEKGDKK